MHYFLIVLSLFSFSFPLYANASDSTRALPSLQSYTGILEMPNARVLPDWSLRLHYGDAHPYRYYGGAVGMWDRLELHGQFTQVRTAPGFAASPEYGHYKDRAAGARLVLKREDDFWPQVALGFFDATGTALFGSRYLVASKMLGDVDVTLGLGQGILAGEYIPDYHEDGNKALGFLGSSPSRRTRVFGGAEWRPTPRLTLVAEYTSIDYSNMFGYRNKEGGIIKEDGSRIPVNFGAKYQINNFLYAQAALLRGDVWAGSIGMEFVLSAEGMQPWKKVEPARAGERLRWQAHAAGNAELARLVAKRLQDEGFREVAVSAGDSTIWIEAGNTVHLSYSRALGHLAVAADSILPANIEHIYLNLRRHGQIIQSLSTSRADLNDFLDGRLDRDEFLATANLQLYARDNRQRYLIEEAVSPLHRQPDPRFRYEVVPRVRSFLNNRAGFFKHKGLMQARAGYNPWQGGLLAGEFELTLFNQFDDLRFTPLERDAVRTDLALYESKSSPRISLLALEQYVELPYSVAGRVSSGIFESAFAGFGAEVFRFFHHGRWGLGLEAATVRKRDPDNNFRLHSDFDQWFTSAFVNLYGQLWPKQGLEAGIKAGRFLAGDHGVRIELRRSFRYFTMGGWYTKTDTSRFTDPDNRGASEKGVYLRIPFSVFRDKPVPGHLRYEITSFTRDQGALVRQPSLLYPMDPWATPIHTRQTLEDMRLRERPAASSGR
jgi:hypothetical protein